MYGFVKIIIYKDILTSVLPCEIGSIGTLDFTFTFDWSARILVKIGQFDPSLRLARKAIAYHNELLLTQLHYKTKFLMKMEFLSEYFHPSLIFAVKLRAYHYNRAGQRASFGSSKHSRLLRLLFLLISYNFSILKCVHTFHFLGQML